MDSLLKNIVLDLVKSIRLSKGLKVYAKGNNSFEQWMQIAVCGSLIRNGVKEEFIEVEKNFGEFRLAFTADDLKGNYNAESLRGNAEFNRWDQGERDKKIREKLKAKEVVEKADWARVLNEILSKEMQRDVYEHFAAGKANRVALDNETENLLTRALGTGICLDQKELECLNRRLLEIIFSKEIGKAKNFYPDICFVKDGKKCAMELKVLISQGNGKKTDLSQVSKDIAKLNLCKENRAIDQGIMLFAILPCDGEEGYTKWAKRAGARVQNDAYETIKDCLELKAKGEFAFRNGVPGYIYSGVLK